MSDLEGTVLSREGGQYRVATSIGEVTAVLRGKVRRAESAGKVVPGDRVVLESSDTGTTYGISATFPRKNVLERRTPEGRGTRPVAANLDHVFVLTATVDPAPIPQLIDRLLVLAEANEIHASVIMNKTDLDPGTQLIERMRKAGYEVFPVSVKQSLGLEPLAEKLLHHTSVLVGPSGAGKSSLLNRIEPGLALRTNEISERVRRGKNTTVSAVMVPLGQGGFLVDTPGYSEVGLWGIEPRELASCFPEMRPLLERCHFADCRHLTEPGCAIKAAVRTGEVAADRYDSYQVLLNELVTAPQDWE